MAEGLVRLDSTRERTAESAEDEATVLIHNNGVTPDNYVILALQTVFGLSFELAEHIAWVTHTQGVARVVTRPRREAQRLVTKAQVAARLDGFPLTFNLEEQAFRPEKRLRKSTIPFAVRSVILLAAFLLALGLAVADEGADITSHDMAPQSDLGITYERHGGDATIEDIDSEGDHNLLVSGAVEHGRPCVNLDTAPFFAAL
jgi:ATP-dependent Clp protease adapter protein ClpS